MNSAWTKVPTVDLTTYYRLTVQPDESEVGLQNKMRWLSLPVQITKNLKIVVRPFCLFAFSVFFLFIFVYWFICVYIFYPFFQ